MNPLVPGWSEMRTITVFGRAPGILIALRSGYAHVLE